MDWVRGWAVPRFYDIKQRRNYSFLTSSSIAIKAKRSDRKESC